MPRIFLSPPHMGGEELHFIEAAFESNYIAPVGPMVDAFEREFARYIGVPYAVAVSSGTAAIHLALRVLGVGPEDEVWLSTLTFVGGVAPVLYLGATPVFFDVSRKTWTLDPELLETEMEAAARRGRLPRAVVPTDLYGQSCDVARIVDICAKYGVNVITDSAEATGALYNGKPVGRAGAAAAFSFNGNKIITTSSGGMLVSRHQHVVEYARFLSQQARDSAAHYQHSTVGYNYRMSNICAAIGRGQLAVLPQRVAARRRVFERYQAGFRDEPGLFFMPEAAYGRSTRWLTVMVIDSKLFGADSETIRLNLERENIEARPVWKPMHLQPLFRGARTVGSLVSEDLFKRGLCLPSGSTLSFDDQERIISIVKRTKRAQFGELPRKM